MNKNAENSPGAKLLARLKRSATLLFFVLPLACLAAEPRDVERYKRVMKDREEVLTMLRATSRIEEVNFPDVIQFIDSTRGTVFLITKEGHPAHPAMVTRHLAEENGRPVIKMDSEAGGDPAAFKRWMDDLAAENKKLVETPEGRANEQQKTKPEARGPAIEYKTVQQALGALKAKPGAQVSEDDGWTTIQDQSSGSTALWAFVPKNHPAYPSVVKRTVLNRNGDLYIDMRVLCEAQKSPCDKLTLDFQELNEQMKKELDARRTK